MARGQAERTARLALFVTGGLAFAKFAAWAFTGSLAILSQAIDSLLDLVALGLVLFAVRISAKPADVSHHYGHAKAENLAAFAQTIFLSFVVGWIAVESIVRLLSDAPEVKAPWYAIALLALSAAVDAWRARLLLSAARSASSDALRAGAVNVATDVGTAVVALVSLLLVRGGAEAADAIGALVVAAAVAVAGYRLGRGSVDVLMDRSRQSDDAAIRAAVARTPGVAETRRVRVRGAGEHLFADVTVAAGRTATLERAHDIAERVEQEIERALPGVDVVVHVEPRTDTSALGERVQGAASRVEGVHEVHNVLVHAFEEGGTNRLHVTLHAKVTSGTTLQAAHALADRVEAAVREEIGESARVDAHMEPLETTAASRDVTRTHSDMVRTLAQIATREPDVVDCHEIIVTSAGGVLSVIAHVRGRGSLPLDQIHEASERIETEMRSTFPDVGHVLIHFEPA